MMSYFAHITREAHVEPQSATVWLSIWVNILPFLCLGIILAIMAYGFKVKLTTLLAATMVYLLLVGVTMFQVAPAASILSLVIGFGLALSSVLMQAKR